MKAWIITIGNEILIGKIVNTNAAWLSQRLTEYGIEVRKIICIPDEEKEIINTILDATNNADLIITTGGLGPTFDDKTSESLAKAFGLKWVVNKEALREIESKYRSKGMEVNNYRIKMAKMPEGATPLRNRVGTAPGILLKIRNKIIISLPGVPNEMKAIFEDYVSKILSSYTPERVRDEKSILVKGIPESSLAPIIDNVMSQYENIYIKSHPKGHEISGPVVELHITVYGKNKTEAKEKLEEVVNRLNNYIQQKLKNHNNEK